MQENGIKPDVVTYNSIINEYVTKGEIDDARKTWEIMQQRGIKPDVVTCASIIGGYAGRGMMDGVMKTLLEMKQLGIKLDVAIYNSIIYGYAEGGMMDGILELMEQCGIIPNESTYKLQLRDIARKDQYGICINKLWSTSCRSKKYTFK